LEDAEWRRRSDTEIAALCQVSRPLVAEIRKELVGKSAHPAELQDETRTVRRAGRTYSMSLNRIRRPKSPKPERANKATLDARPGLNSIVAQPLSALRDFTNSFEDFPTIMTMAEAIKENGIFDAGRAQR
jgi:hypothetical protein